MKPNNPFGAAVHLDDFGEDAAGEWPGQTKERAGRKRWLQTGAACVDHAATADETAREQAHIAAGLAGSDWQVVATHRSRNVSMQATSGKQTERGIIVAVRNHPDHRFGDANHRHSAIGEPLGGICDNDCFGQPSQ